MAVTLEEIYTRHDRVHVHDVEALDRAVVDLTQRITRRLVGASPANYAVCLDCGCLRTLDEVWDDWCPGCKAAAR